MLCFQGIDKSGPRPHSEWHWPSVHQADRPASRRPSKPPEPWPKSHQAFEAARRYCWPWPSFGKQQICCCNTAHLSNHEYPASRSTLDRSFKSSATHKSCASCNVLSFLPSPHQTTLQLLRKSSWLWRVSSLLQGFSCCRRLGDKTLRLDLTANPWSSWIVLHASDKSPSAWK